MLQLRTPTTGARAPLRCALQAATQGAPHHRIGAAAAPGGRMQQQRDCFMRGVTA